MVRRHQHQVGQQRREQRTAREARGIPGDERQRDRGGRQRHRQRVARHPGGRAQREQQREFAHHAVVQRHREPRRLDGEHRDEDGQHGEPERAAREQPGDSGDEQRQVEPQLDRQRPQRAVDVVRERVVGKRTRQPVDHLPAQRHAPRIVEGLRVGEERCATAARSTHPPARWSAASRQPAPGRCAARAPRRKRARRAAPASSA